MPTKEQMEVVSDQIRDIVGRNYIESDGDQCSCWFQPEGGGVVGVAVFQGSPEGTPEPFADLPSQAKADLLVTCVSWEGFTVDQRHDVSQRVIDGDKPELWMSGIGENRGPDLESGRTIGQFIREKDIDGYLSWLTGDPEKTRERLQQVEAYDIESDEALSNRPVRPLTEQLIEAAHLDVWPSMAAIVDFGIDSESHLGALQFAIKYGEVTPEELDAAMGDGAKLTEIAQRGDNPYRDVTFRTSWDNLRLESEEHDASELFSEAPVQAAPSEKLQFEKILHGTTTPEVKQEGGSKEMEGREM